jgi:5-methyltetrahydrofolate--homocysteine methyltransferase
MPSFLETLRSGRVLLMDGAMGTELQRAGIGENEWYEMWNLRHPEKVSAIHRAYVGGGAEVLLTNTFQANVGRFVSDPVEKAHQAGVSLARAVAGPDCFVLHDMGPFAEYSHRLSSFLTATSVPQFGADALLLETCSDTLGLANALQCRQKAWLRSKGSGLPVLFSWTFQRNSDGSICTFHGQLMENCARMASEFEIAALGVNCGRDIGMDETVEVIRCYRQVTDLPLFARPNAGTPTQVGDRWVYPLTPEKMAERLPELLEAGVSMVGGCCGTTPEHIAAMRPIVNAWNRKRGFE